MSKPENYWPDLMKINLEGQNNDVGINARQN